MIIDKLSLRLDNGTGGTVNLNHIRACELRDRLNRLDWLTLTQNNPLHNYEETSVTLCLNAKDRLHPLIHVWSILCQHCTDNVEQELHYIHRVRKVELKII